MLIVVIAVSVIIGFVVGAGAIGVAAQRMGHQRSQPIWRQEMAATFVEEHLSFEIAAELKPAELRDLLRRHINHLQFAQSPQKVQPEPGPAEPARVEPARVESSSTTLTAHEEAIATLYAETRASGVEITKPMVEEVMSVHAEYLRSIGALVRSPAK